MSERSEPTTADATTRDRTAAPATTRPSGSGCPGPGSPAGVPRVRIAPLGRDGMAALLRGDLDAAGAAAGVRLTAWLAGADCRWLWRLRLDDIARDPRAEAWVAGALVDEETAEVVGHAGFHGPPDPAGMVEVAYTTDPAFRRRGYARAALAALLRRAAADPTVRTVRASVSPGNAASLATLRRFGFTHTGEQWDDEDGLELVFERPA